MLFDLTSLFSWKGHNQHKYCRILSLILVIQLIVFPQRLEGRGYNSVALLSIFGHFSYTLASCDANDPRTVLRAECQPTYAPTLAVSIIPSTDENQDAGRSSRDSTPKNQNSNNQQSSAYNNDGSYRLSSGYDFSDSVKYLLQASDGREYDHFGFSVAMGKHLAVVGAHQHRNSGMPSNYTAITILILLDTPYRCWMTGAAYIYSLNHPQSHSAENSKLDWTQLAKVVSDDIREDDNFGYSIAVNDRSVYIGAFRADRDKDKSNAGAVYLFEESQSDRFVQSQKLLSFKPVADEFFGYAIATEGKFLVVSAYGNTDKGQNAGIVYVFIRQERTIYFGNNARIYASDAKPYHLFGSSLALLDGRLVVGAMGDDAHGTASGAAYVYNYDADTNSWSNEWKLVAAESNQYDYYGCSVGIYGDTAVVGAYLADGLASTTGVVFVYTRDTVVNAQTQASKPVWRQMYRLMPLDGHPNSYFGRAVLITEKLILVGSPGDGTIASTGGAAYAYQVGADGDWELVARVSAAGKGGGQEDKDDGFGGSLAVFDDIVVVGAEKGDGLEADSGVAFVYTPLEEYTSGTASVSSSNDHSSELQELLRLASQGQGRLVTASFAGVVLLFAVIISVLAIRNHRLYKEKLKLRSAHTGGGGVAVGASSFQHPHHGLPSLSRHSRYDGEGVGTALDISNLHSYSSNPYSERPYDMFPTATSDRPLQHQHQTSTSGYVHPDTLHRNISQQQQSELTSSGNPSRFPSSHQSQSQSSSYMAGLDCQYSQSQSHPQVILPSASGPPMIGRGGVPLTSISSASAPYYPSLRGPNMGAADDKRSSGQHSNALGRFPTRGLGGGADVDTDALGVLDISNVSLSALSWSPNVDDSVSPKHLPMHLQPPYRGKYPTVQSPLNNFV